MINFIGIGLMALGFTLGACDLLFKKSVSGTANFVMLCGISVMVLR